MFQKATKKESKARIALLGPAGSGKTFTALRLAHQFGTQIAYIDTERGSASKYAGDPNPDGGNFAFDVVDSWPDFRAERFVSAIQAAEKAGYQVLIIDSLSHAWSGPGGILEFVDGKKGNSANGFSAWREATPAHNKLVDTILNCRMHVIITMRVKMDYVQEKDPQTNKTTVRKVGLQPVQRDGVEYEFDIIGDINSGNITISKTRCSALADRIYSKPGRDMALPILEWLSGEPVVEPPKFIAGEWLAE